MSIYRRSETLGGSPSNGMIRLQTGWFASKGGELRLFDGSLRGVEGVANEPSAYLKFFQMCFGYAPHLTSVMARPLNGEGSVLWWYCMGLMLFLAGVGRAGAVAPTVPAPPADLPRYDLSIQLDTNDHTAKLTANVTWTNRIATAIFSFMERPTL